MDTLRFDSLTHAILRVGVGLLFLQHGLQKVFGMFGGQAVPLGSLMGLAGLLELGGGLLLIAGFLTRPVGAVLAIEMLAAYFMAHQPQGGMPVQNGGELPLLFALTFVFLAGHGAGPLSVDAAIARARVRRDVEAEDLRRAA